MSIFFIGQEYLDEALEISAALFSGDVSNLTASQIEQGFKNMPSADMPIGESLLVDWLIEAGIEPSKRQAREDIKNGAITLNGEKVTDLEFTLTPAHSFDERFVLVRKGKKNYTLVTLTK